MNRTEPSITGKRRTETAKILRSVVEVSARPAISSLSSSTGSPTMLFGPPSVPRSPLVRSASAGLWNPQEAVEHTGIRSVGPRNRSCRIDTQREGPIDEARGRGYCRRARGVELGDRTVGGAQETVSQRARIHNASRDRSRRVDPAKTCPISIPWALGGHSVGRGFTASDHRLPKSNRLETISRKQAAR